MEKKSGEFSIEEMMRLASTPAGQQLISLLQQADPEALRNAAKQASEGTLSQLPGALRSILDSEEAKSLLKQLGG